VGSRRLRARIDVGNTTDPMPTPFGHKPTERATGPSLPTSRMAAAATVGDHVAARAARERPSLHRTYTQ